MNTHDWQVYVVEKFMMILDRQTRVEEHHDFLLPILLEECEEQQETLVGWTYNIALEEKGQLVSHKACSDSGIT